MLSGFIWIRHFSPSSPVLQAPGLIAGSLMLLRLGWGNRHADTPALDRFAYVVFVCKRLVVDAQGVGYAISMRLVAGNAIVAIDGICSLWMEGPFEVRARIAPPLALHGL